MVENTACWEVISKDSNCSAEQRSAHSGCSMCATKRPVIVCIFMQPIFFA